jgi:hypothetical protein
MSAEAMTVDDPAAMRAVLAVIQHGDEHDALVDNAIIAKQTGYDLDLVAALLEDAKERSLVWGRRTGDKPAPWFSELEVTVQGKRLLK